MISYVLFIITIGGIYALLALSLNLSWGMTGMVNLGLAAFFALGAYTTAIVTHAGAPIAVGVATATVIGILAGLLVTFATTKLRDDYLAIVTLGFAEVLRLVALNERWLTHGADGISGVPSPFGTSMGQQDLGIPFLLLITVAMLLVLGLLVHIDRSPYGRVLKSIREDQELAAFAGKRVLAFKLQAFALSAAIAALAGALYVHFQSYISPDHFQPLMTIYIFLAVTAGGIGRPTAAVLGAYGVVAFLELTRFIAGVIPGLQAVQLAALREILVGATLIGILMFKPSGLMPEKMPKSGVSQ